jgi:hypothetical protein
LENNKNSIKAAAKNTKTKNTAVARKSKNIAILTYEQSQVCMDEAA